MTGFEKDLIESGFTEREVYYLNKNIERYGSSLQSVVTELGKRFRVVLGITLGVTLMFIALIAFAARHNIISGGISLAIVLLIAWFFQPPVVTYKAWRFEKQRLSS
ncbi:hypothetical protein HF650_24510 (plasmid) [Kosakonia sp. SMBL-WEM22]|jgi:membrane protein YdbS with pleckstrin-like domain|uniref:hypothetical protein n=1 Tax=Kosakonia sp. SMBL-WEM22 TaxID=2725560 RepID=UPI0016595030|nr:hypothetical protein [Kosakonia sp. SMBL-WEM22]QNQ22929.1 hypothetical protein HF650_24510 [Kosakonia sp. SMBL-WEM22]